jgi:hypothetical protein
MRMRARASCGRKEVDQSMSLPEIMTFALAGLAVVGAVAFAGHQINRATASIAPQQPSAQWADVISPATTIASKGSLLDEPVRQDFRMVAVDGNVRVASLGKSDFISEEIAVAPSATQQASLGALPEAKPADPVKLVSIPAAPKISKLENSFKLAREEKQRVLKQRDFRLAEKDCLARAIYFEARSEPEAGQIAVANVILNRVKSSSYPDTICGVVYEGAHRMNSCQFSFACDGKKDIPTGAKQWAKAKQLASRAMAGDAYVRVVSTATHYHADYVNPRWSGAMKRLIKIGRHIFYHDS